MTYKPTLPPVTTPNEKPNNRAILQAKFAVDMLSGVTNLKSPDRAVRLGELLESGLFAVDSSGLLVPKGSATADTSAISSGRNLLINGDFNTYTRGTSSALASIGGELLGPDRWVYAGFGITGNWGLGTDTTGTLPHSRYFMGFNVATVAAGAAAWVGQKIERVAPTAGNKVTISFWMRSNVAGKKVGIRMQQVFGTGGSVSPAVDTLGKVITLTTTFQKYTHTYSLPSVAGKSFGSNENDYLYVLFDLCGPVFGSELVGQTGLFELGEVQVELGSVAHEFDVTPLAQQRENCNRYTEEIIVNRFVGVTFTPNGDSRAVIPFATRKRVAPVITPVGFTSINLVGFGRSGEFVNLDSGNLQWQSTVDAAVITGVGNISGISPSGIVVVWSTTSSIRLIADAEF